MKRKGVNISAAATGCRIQYRTRVASEGEEEGGGEGGRGGVSSWTEDDSMSTHNSPVSPDKVPELVTTGTFSEPLHLLVDEFLRAISADQRMTIRMNPTTPDQEHGDRDRVGGGGSEVEQPGGRLCAARDRDRTEGEGSNWLWRETLGKKTT